MTLPPEAVTLLRSIRVAQLEHRLKLGTAWEDQGFVFTRADGQPLDPDQVSRAFARLRKAAGVPPIRLHDLRHTHASLLLQDGENVKVVSERLGHSSTQVTMDVYAHVLPGMQEAAAVRVSKVIGDL